MKKKFENWKPKQETIDLLKICQNIIFEYAAEGYTLSLRQLYYQMVARDHIPNRAEEYKRIGRIINRGRLAGLVDWEIIEDRGRRVISNTSWQNPAHIIKSAARQFQIDRWEEQHYRVFVLVEKDALSGVLEPVCRELDVYFTACKGYTSQSHIWEISKIIRDSHSQSPVVLYFGDHDPSGLDMDRDLFDRISLLSGTELETFDRLALTHDQIEKYNPPPNPAKMTDSRARGYVQEFGPTSYELDAMEPRLLAELARTAILDWRDQDVFDDAIERETEMKETLQKVIDDLEE